MSEGRRLFKRPKKVPSRGVLCRAVLAINRSESKTVNLVDTELKRSLLH